ncbi:hypothetical protein BT69DRAFT_1260053 [Atractiella rhizophila]|nr:hypothetical protein BT69DRAFT_1260053 [Atractiella rhizophila]
MTESLQVAPAPWALKCSSVYMIMTSYVSLPSSTALRAGAFHPSEEAALKPEDLKGGPGGVLIIRYAESPVGPYDELMYIPGFFQTPERKKKLRITRIYVSTAASTFSGRKNWNIPKHVANFSFNKTARGTQISVSEPHASTPFFSAVVAPIPLLPSIPFSTSLVAPVLDLELVQPPLPKGVKEEEADTEEWKGTAFRMKGWLGLAKVKDCAGDGLGWIDMKDKFHSLGYFMTAGTEVNFLEPRAITSKL